MFSLTSNLNQVTMQKNGNMNKFAKQRRDDMALIRCPECGKEVSDKAEHCIHCGFPLNQPVDLLKAKTNAERKQICIEAEPYVDRSRAKVLDRSSSTEYVFFPIRYPKQPGVFGKYTVTLSRTFSSSLYYCRDNAGNYYEIDENGNISSMSVSTIHTLRRNNLI